MLHPCLAPPAGPTPIGPRRLARHLPGLRRELERQRDFRVEQLAQLLACEGIGPSSRGPGPHAHDTDASRALQEVRGLLIAGARRALSDIEVALTRMSQGRYGWCRDCGTSIPLAVLTAVPRSTTCLDCQVRTGRRSRPDGGPEGRHDAHSGRHGPGPRP